MLCTLFSQRQAPALAQGCTRLEVCGLTAFDSGSLILPLSLNNSNNNNHFAKHYCKLFIVI